MRGVPTNPVLCIACHSPTACAADRLCHSCRIRRRPPANKRFIWTFELDERLRRAYQSASTRATLTENLNALQKITGFTRVVVLNRAAELGLAFSTRRPWEPG